MAYVVCPRNEHCSQWARIYIKYCLCSARDGVSLMLGLISIISWGVAEIPQIVTNYNQKSAEGLSLAFLITWILGDLFNLFGCMLEPTTLPTQSYMAMLFTMTTVVLAAETIYYGHIYPRLKHKRRCHKGPKPDPIEAAGKVRQSNDEFGAKQVNTADRWITGSDTFDRGNVLSSPIPLPAFPRICSPGRELYYTSARSLARSHTPTAGSVLAQRMTPPTSLHSPNSIEEPLLGGDVSTQSKPPPNTKTLLCLVSAIMFLGTYNLHGSVNNGHNMVFYQTNQGFVIQVGRKLLQVGGGLLQENGIEGSPAVGTFLGWAMAAIYMGGRLPQICLNIRRGNVEGLNSLMFIFALVGNSTYVASILVESLDWSRIKPNLPWLVDAGGCVLLDTLILMQFIYFRYWSPKDVEDKHGNSNAA